MKEENLLWNGTSKKYQRCTRASTLPKGAHAEQAVLHFGAVAASPVAPVQLAVSASTAQIWRRKENETNTTLLDDLAIGEDVSSKERDDTAEDMDIWITNSPQNPNN